MTGRVWAIALLLLGSGACALTYQVAWLREFRLVFGGSTTASAAVLAVFMGGLGLGNWLLGRWADRHPAPLRLYAQLELGIAAACAISPWLITATRLIYSQLGGQTTLGVTGATLVRLLATVIVLGLPTVLMGGTLPAAAKAVVGEDDKQRRGLGLVYGFNTLGAVVGAFACTFLLLQTFGTRTTLWLACLLNVVLALMAWKLAQQPWMTVDMVASRRERKRHKQAEASADDAPALDNLPPAGWVYASALLVGASFFVMELVWYRMLAPLLGGTTYSFGLILAVALAGIGLGGSLYPLLFRRSAPRPWHFALTCSLQALCLAVPLAWGDHLAISAARWLAANETSFASTAGAWTFIASIVVFPAALVAGVQFPLLIALLGRGQEQLARQVGTAFAFNTLGCILGSLIGGFGLLPLLSAPGVWRVVIVVLALLTGLWLVLAWRVSTKHIVLAIPSASLVAALLLLLVPGPTAVWRHSAIGAGRSRIDELHGNQLTYRLHDIRSEVQWEADGVESSLAIRGANGLAFYVNGKSDGNALGDAGTQIMLGMVPATLHPQPRTALVVGLGTGETAGWLGAIPEIERVDCVELEPAVVEMARRCALANHNVLENPKVHLAFNDAREILTATPATYDLIVSEPSNPYRAGVANLFTQEFYRAVRQRLNQGGLFGQWLQAYEVDAETIGLVLHTLRQEFPQVEVWQLKGHDLLLVASLEPVKYDAATLRSKLQQEPYQSALRIAWRGNSVEGFLSGYVGNVKFVDELAEAGYGQVNTDDLNHLEYAFARTVGHDINISINELRNASIAQQAHRPPVQGKVDWERVTDHYLLNYLADEQLIPFVSGLSTDQAARWAAWNAHIRTDHRSAIEAWDRQARAPETSTELAALAVSMVHQHDPRAPQLIEQLRALEPIEADMLDALVAFRDGDFRLAEQHCRRALLSLREDPWPVYVQPLCRLTELIATREPKLTPALYEAISTPFALEARDRERDRSAFVLAQQLGGETLLKHLEQYEPHVPWTEDFLRIRAETYAQAKHPLAPLAQRQLKAFQAAR